MPANDFELFEKVGQGAQGAVFRAKHIPTGDIVAVKVIDVSCLDAKERQSVLREVEVLAAMKIDPHPNVLLYRESFVKEESLHIVLDWCDGGTLLDRFHDVQETKIHLPEDEIWHYFLSLCLALEHLHSHGVLHRDVKMANVFLRSSEGRFPCCQLGDFGMSCILGDRSKAQTVVGTPYYLSPELCMGKPYNCKSDVWSLGVVLFVLLNNKMPFEASNYAALILRIVQEEHARHTFSYSPTLHRMATWCMQKNENNRPTIREILLHGDCVSAASRLSLDLPYASSKPSTRRTNKVSSPVHLDTIHRPLPTRRTVPGAIQSKRRPRTQTGRVADEPACNVKRQPSQCKCTPQPKSTKGKAAQERMAEAVARLPSYSSSPSSSEGESADPRTAEKYLRQVLDPVITRSSEEERRLLDACLPLPSQSSPPKEEEPEMSSERVASVLWKVDDAEGCAPFVGQPPPSPVKSAAAGALHDSAGMSADVRDPTADPMHLSLPTVASDNDESVHDPTCDVSLTPLETFLSERELRDQAQAICSECEDLVGPAAFAELVDMLKSSSAMSAAALQQFINDRVPADKVHDVTHLCFRYVFLDGERQRLASSSTA